MNPQCRLPSFLFSFYIFTSCIYLSSASIGKKCDMHFLNVCDTNETCEEINHGEGECSCIPSFKKINGVCVKSEPEVSTFEPSVMDRDQSLKDENTTVVVFAWISCLLIVAIGIVIVLAKRFKWIDKLHKLTIRNYNTVLVSSSNDDDAPIT